MFNFLTYNKLKSQKWQNLSPMRRLKVFQKIENIMAKKQNRRPFTICNKSWKDGVLGLCSYRDRMIYLNSDFFTKPNFQFLGLATLFHEERHIHQNIIVRTKKKFFKFSKAYKWQQNMKNYIKYSDKESYSYYAMQEVELDANKFAINTLRKFYRRFKNDPIYLKSLEIKEQEFNFTKSFAKEELGPFYKLKLFFRKKRK